MGCLRRSGARLDNLEIHLLSFLKEKPYSSTPTIAKAINIQNKDKIYSKLKALENKGLVKSFGGKETRIKYYYRQIEGERRLKVKSGVEISKSPKFTVEGEYEKNY